MRTLTQHRINISELYIVDFHAKGSRPKTGLCILTLTASEYLKVNSTYTLGRVKLALTGIL